MRLKKWKRKSRNNLIPSKQKTMKTPQHISLIINEINIFSKEPNLLVFKRLKTKKAVKLGDFTAQKFNF